MTMKFQGWRLPPLGALTAASRSFQMSSSGTGSGLRRRIARWLLMASNMSTGASLPVYGYWPQISTDGNTESASRSPVVRDFGQEGEKRFVEGLRPLHRRQGAAVRQHQLARVRQAFGEHVCHEVEVRDVVLADDHQRRRHDLVQAADDVRRVALIAGALAIVDGGEAAYHLAQTLEAVGKAAKAIEQRVGQPQPLKRGARALGPDRGDGGPGPRGGLT